MMMKFSKRQGRVAKERELSMWQTIIWLKNQGRQGTSRSVFCGGGKRAIRMKGGGRAVSLDVMKCKVISKL